MYLAQLGLAEVSAPMASFLKHASFAFMVASLAVGAFIIVGAMVRGYPTA